MEKISIYKLAATTTERVKVRYVAIVGGRYPGGGRSYEEVSLVGLSVKIGYISDLDWSDIEDALEKDGAWISKED